MKRHYVLDPDGVIDVELTQTWKGRVRVTPRLIEYVQQYVNEDKTFQEALYEYINGDIDINAYVVWHGDTMENRFIPCDSHNDWESATDYCSDHSKVGRTLQIPGYEPYLGMDYAYVPSLNDDNSFVDTQPQGTDIALHKLGAETHPYVVEVDANKNREEIDSYWDTVRWKQQREREQAKAREQE